LSWAVDVAVLVTTCLTGAREWRTHEVLRAVPVAPYMAVGLSTVVHGIAERKHIERNLAIIEDAIHAAVSIIINMPVKLIALAEGALTGFTDEIFDIPHVPARGDAGPLLQHVVRDLTGGRDRPPGGEEPPLVP